MAKVCSTLLILLVCADHSAQAQVCRISAAGLNRNRKVAGPIHAECPISLHTPPFGNWGVTSNFGQKQDDRQFEGWCHNTRVCDNSGNCSVQCRDGWFEWNSCTDISQYQPPNTTLYNSGNGTLQITATGNNVHGTRVTDIPVRCPTDANSDGVAEAGGCADLVSHSSGVNFMSLYELDPGSTDDLIQTIYFPELVVSTGCNTWNCPSVSSEWVFPIGYDSPSNPAKVSAEVAMLINSGVFIDNNRGCRLPALRAESVSAASYARAPIAPESIATIFGQGLAMETASATSLPLPLTLGSSSVNVVDSNRISRPAPLFYSSPGQINYLVPSGTALGQARVVVSRQDGITSQTTLQIETFRPGIFSANANGSGVAAAVATRVAQDGTQTSVPVFQCGAAAGSCVPVPIPLGPETDQIILLLFGTGIRFHSGLSTVQVTIGGQPAQVLYAGAQGEFVGLDQLNVRIPRVLAVRGPVNVLVTVGNRAANAVTIDVR